MPSVITSSLEGSRLLRQGRKRILRSNHDASWQYIKGRCAARVRSNHGAWNRWLSSNGLLEIQCTQWFFTFRTVREGMTAARIGEILKAWEGKFGGNAGGRAVHLRAVDAKTNHLWKPRFC